VQGEDETWMRPRRVGKNSVEMAGAPVIGQHPGLTCDPGSAPNGGRLACAPRTSSLNTNCVKELSIVMRHRLHLQDDRLLATASVGSYGLRLKSAKISLMLTAMG
jgi:hypothetical protein